MTIFENGKFNLTIYENGKFNLTINLKIHVQSEFYSIFFRLHQAQHHLRQRSGALPDIDNFTTMYFRGGNKIYTVKRDNKGRVIQAR